MPGGKAGRGSGFAIAAQSNHRLADIARFSTWFELERRAARRYDAQPPGLWRDFVEGLVLWMGFQL